MTPVLISQGLTRLFFGGGGAGGERVLYSYRLCGGDAAALGELTLDWTLTELHPPVCKLVLLL